MKFNSQICTTKEQSELLLALGLSPETADMCRTLTDQDHERNEYSVECMSIGQGEYQLLHPDYYTPAWSLHRLMEIGNFVNVGFLNIDKIYECCVRMLEGQIRGGIIDRKFINKID